MGLEWCLWALLIVGSSATEISAPAERPEENKDDLSYVMAFPVEDKIIAEESEPVARSLPLNDPMRSSTGNEDSRTMPAPEEEKQLPSNDGKSDQDEQVVLIINDSDEPKIDISSPEQFDDAVVFPSRQLGHFPPKPITEDKNFGNFPFKPKSFPQEKVKFPLLPLNKIKSKWLSQGDSMISRREDSDSSSSLFDPSALLNRASSLLRRSLSKALPLQGFGSKLQETVIFPIMDDSSSSSVISLPENPSSSMKSSNMLPPSLSSLLLVPPFSSLSSLLPNAVESQPIQVTPKPLFAPESRSESRHMPYTFHSQSPPMSLHSWAPSFMAPHPPPMQSYFPPHSSFHYYPPPTPFVSHPYHMQMSPYTAHPFHLPPPHFMQFHMNPFMPLPSHPPWQYTHAPQSPFPSFPHPSHSPQQFIDFQQPPPHHQNGPNFRPSMPFPPPPPMNNFMPQQAPENRAHVSDNMPVSGTQEIQIPIEIPISIPMPERGPSRNPSFRNEPNPEAMTEEIIIIPREDNSYMSVPPDSLPYKVDGANEDAYILLYPAEDGSFSLKPPFPINQRQKQSVMRQLGGSQRMSPRKMKMLRDMLLSKAIRNDDEPRQGSVAMPLFHRPTRMRQVVRETRIFTNLRPALLPQFQPSNGNSEEEASFHAPIFRSRGF